MEELKIYSYSSHVSGQYIEQCLVKAQGYATQNCGFIGAQGMLREESILDKINCEFDGNIKRICDQGINWEYNCAYCYNEEKSI